MPVLYYYRGDISEQDISYSHAMVSQDRARRIVLFPSPRDIVAREKERVAMRAENFEGLIATIILRRM